jgi:glycosyltransferase involved in cell wall biosynthesis
LRFVYHHRTQGRGGEGVHIAHMVRALVAEGHEVAVVSPPGVDPLGMAGSPPVDKSDTRVNGLSRLWRWVSRHWPQVGFEVLELAYNVYAVVRLRFILPRQAGAVFYERYAFFLWWSTWLAKRRRLPVILEVNEVAGVQRARGLVMERVAQRLERATFGRADALLVVSSYLEDEVRRRGARDGCVHVIPNAVDAATVEVGAERARTRDELGVNGCTVIGFLGWFDQWDRLDVLVAVFSTLHRSRPDARLLLVGDGPVASALRADIERLGLAEAVIMTGPVARADVPRHLEAMDIGVLPSSNAFGSPIALFEMMAAGIPVVAPDVRPVLDVLEHGVTGLIVPLGDRVALGAALDRLAADGDLRTRLGGAARRRIAEAHTWTANARRVAEIARQCTGAAL